MKIASMEDPFRAASSLDGKSPGAPIERGQALPEMARSAAVMSIYVIGLGSTNTNSRCRIRYKIGCSARASLPCSFLVLFLFPVRY
jgi:hypothetical protein